MTLQIMQSLLFISQLQHERSRPILIMPFEALSPKLLNGLPSGGPFFGGVAASIGALAQPML
jgi:hypothetical protein